MGAERRAGGGHRGWLERIGQALGGEPRDREALLTVLRDAQGRGLLDLEQLSMIEGVLHVSELRARDIMIPRPQATTLNRDTPPREMLGTIVATGYSRFPVTAESRDDVVGILIAKDMLRLFTEQGDRFDIREVLRPALFIPEAKRLDALLKQFRESRSHMSVVVDEYGAFAGIVTIEDVIEQIVGEIDDEHDFDEDTTILPRDDGSFVVKAVTAIEDFNEYFGTALADDELDTVGGVVARRFGHVPRKGEAIVIDHLRFQVVRADTRRIHLLAVTPTGGDAEGEDGG